MRSEVVVVYVMFLECVGRRLGMFCRVSLYGSVEQRWPAARGGCGISEVSLWIV